MFHQPIISDKHLRHRRCEGQHPNVCPLPHLAAKNSSGVPLDSNCPKPVFPSTAVQRFVAKQSTKKKQAFVFFKLLRPGYPDRCVAITVSSAKFPLSWSFFHSNKHFEWKLHSEVNAIIFTVESANLLKLQETEFSIFDAREDRKWGVAKCFILETILKLSAETHWIFTRSYNDKVPIQPFLPTS